MRVNDKRSNGDAAQLSVIVAWMVITKEIRLRLLGYPELSGQLPGKVMPSKAYQLLALLALSSRQRMPRSEIAAFLWDRSSTEEGLTNLRQLLARIRKLLPDHEALLVTEGSMVSLGPVAEQNDLQALHDLKTATVDDKITGLQELYRGELLAGLTDFTEVFSEWLAQERTSVVESYLRLATISLIDLTRYGRADVSLVHDIGKRMLDAEKGRESTYVTLIEVYGRLGLVADAARLQVEMQRVLHDDSDVAPSPEAMAVVRRVLTRHQAVPARTAEEKPRKMVAEPPRLAFLEPKLLQMSASHGMVVRALIEDVANETARFEGVSTIAPHSTFQLSHDGGQLSPSGEMKVDYTVSGFVRPGNGFGVLALRMVKSDTASIIWSGEFELKEDLLTQSFRAISSRVSASLVSGLEKDLRQALSRTKNNLAYLSFLTAQDAMKGCDLKSVRRARKAFQSSIDEDADFASAHAGISQTLYHEWLLLGGNDPNLLLRALAYAEASIERDPNAAGGHWRKAMASLYRKDFDGTEESFEIACQLSPNAADLLLDYSDALGFIGDANVAWSLFERALELNPMPPDHYWWAGASIAFSKADYRGAIDLCQKLDSDESVLRLLAASHGMAGETREAKRYGRRLAEVYPGETAYHMARLQPHRTEDGLRTFVEGLRVAGIP